MAAQVSPTQVSPALSRAETDDGRCELIRAGLMETPTDAQSMGSKRMVDMFLSSRRRRIRGSTGTTDNSSPAFI